MAKSYGSKRIVVGAHYGMTDWLSQRVTAVLMAAFTTVLLVQVLVLQVGSIVWLMGCAGWAVQVLWRL